MIASLREDLRGDKFLYIDRDGNWMTKLREEAEEKGKSQIIQGDASSLMVAPNSINTLFAKDVLGQQNQLDIDAKHKLTGNIVDVGSITGLAKEWSRVVKQDGKVIILETGTPPAKDSLVNAFRSEGFEVVENYGKDGLGKIFGTEDIEDEALGKAVSRTAVENAYALVFKKGKINHL